MFHLSEWLPNPAGKDSPSQVSNTTRQGQGEWVEIWNDAPRSAALEGWSLRTSKGRPVPLHGRVPARGYAVLTKKDFKFTLRNADESVSLYDPAGRLAGQSSYRGQAPAGKSVNRSGARSYFADPTPGRPNQTMSAVLIVEPHPYGVPLVHFSYFQPVAMMLGTAAAVTAAILFVLSAHEGLQELFFSRY